MILVIFKKLKRSERRTILFYRYSKEVMHDSVFFFKAFVGLLAAPFIILSSLVTPQKPQIRPGSMENYSSVPQETSTPVKNNLTSPMSGLEMTETGYQTTDRQVSITPSPMVQTTYSNPKVDCTGPDGKHLQITQKECDDFNNAWNTPKVQPKPSNNPQTLPSSANNIYCYDNTNKISFYTSSGDECNKINLQRATFHTSPTYTACADTQKQKDNACDTQCSNQADTDGKACGWAYLGPTAGIAEDFNKYQECSNESTVEFTKCLDKCSTQFSEDLKQCHD